MTIQAQDDTLDVQSVNLQSYGNESDSLYKGHNYNYYNEIYKKAITCKRTGIVLAILGLGAGITGGIYMNIDFDIGTPLLL